MNFDNELISSHKGEAQGKLEVKWLHGTPGKNLSARVDMHLQSVSTRFKKFKGYTFDDESKNFSTIDKTIYEEELDELGNGNVALLADLGSSAPGMMKAHLTTKVFEKGGGFSVDRTSVKCSPYKQYVGIKLPKGDLWGSTLSLENDHRFNIAVVDEFGEPLTGKKVQVKVFHITRRWWWNSYENSNLSNYISSKSTHVRLDKTVTSKSGKASIVFKGDESEYGRYFVQVIDPETGHSAGKMFRMDYPYWRRSKDRESENPTMLSFSTDKKKYDVGERVKISFPSSKNGKALVSIESGVKVLTKFVVETTDKQTEVSFVTTKDMSPNVYAHISLIQPHDQVENDLPLRLYGIVPVKVENQESHLNPEINMPTVLHPETKAKINIKEKDGKPMTYTLAIVDEGLLDLTAFKTPQPWNHFYAKEAIGVMTWDMYDYVIGSFKSHLDNRLAIGGDGSASGEEKSAKANRFKPMVRFVGPFQLDPHKSKSHLIDVPNYVGSVRVMVVAGEDGAYGNAEKTVPVRNPLMVLGTLPRVLGPKEKVSLPVNVFALEKHVKNVEVTITTNDMLRINGSKKQTIKFDNIGDEVVTFDLDVANRLGIGKVKIVAKSGKEIAKHEVELDVRSPNPRVTDVIETIVEPGKSWNKSVLFNGMEGTNNVSVEVSNIPPVDLDRRLRYLIQYPHGCVEQTTSSAFPQLFLSDVMELNSNKKLNIDNNVKAAIERLKRFQTYDGGLAYWPGGGSSNEWGTNYASHFLFEAESKGYVLGKSFKKGIIKYQKRQAKNWKKSNYDDYYYGSSRSHELIQAYRLYLLALVNEPELGAMNRMRELDLDELSKWRLAAAYNLAGQHTVAKDIIEDLSTDVPDYQELSYSYGSTVRDEAMILETLVLMKERSKGGFLAKKNC